MSRAVRRLELGNSPEKHGVTKASTWPGHWGVPPSEHRRVLCSFILPFSDQLLTSFPACV